jgi:hypothetical protein
MISNWCIIASRRSKQQKKNADAYDTLGPSFLAFSFLTMVNCTSSSADPSCATHAPPSVSSSASTSISSGLSLNTSCCRSTGSKRFDAKTRSLMLSIVSSADASSI